MDSSTCCTICSYKREERTILYMTSSSRRSHLALWYDRRTKENSPKSSCLTRDSSLPGGVVGPIYHRLLDSANYLGGLLNPYRLDVRELTDSMGPQFSPVTGPFHSPEGHTRIGSHHAVYENHSGFQIVDEAFALILVVRPGARPQPKPAVVRDSNRVIKVRSPEHARHRTKQLLVVCR